MKAIALAARKGGSSKTTLAAHIAVEASADQKVMLVDTDPQGSLTYWWDDRKADVPGLLDVSLARVKQELDKVRGQEGLVVIDTPPLDSSMISAVLEAVDLVVIPVKPSPHDLRGVAVTVELAKKAGKPFLFVITQAVTRAQITAQARPVLEKYGPVAATIMSYRVDFAGAMTDGRTVQELDPGGKAAGEIAGIWNDVKLHISHAVKADNSL